jgi:hypothetical protein
MSTLKIEDFRFSSSSIDDFFEPSKKSLRTATMGKVRVGSVSQLSGFRFVADDKLVRLSQNDFWHLGQDESGYFIERLVSDDEGPIKET